MPYDPVELPVNAQTHGLVAPEQYEIPQVSPLWTPMAYAAFDDSKLAGNVSFPIYFLGKFIQVLRRCNRLVCLNKLVHLLLWND